jgi:hypothetical protein
MKKFNESLESDIFKYGKLYHEVTFDTSIKLLSKAVRSTDEDSFTKRELSYFESLTHDFKLEKKGERRILLERTIFEEGERKNEKISVKKLEDYHYLIEHTLPRQTLINTNLMSSKYYTTDDFIGVQQFIWNIINKNEI